MRYVLICILLIGPSLVFSYDLKFLSCFSLCFGITSAFLLVNNGFYLNRERTLPVTSYIPSLNSWKFSSSSKLRQYEDFQELEDGVYEYQGKDLPQFIKKTLSPQLKDLEKPKYKLKPKSEKNYKSNVKSKVESHSGKSNVKSEIKMKPKFKSETNEEESSTDEESDLDDEDKEIEKLERLIKAKFNHFSLKDTDDDEEEDDDDDDKPKSASKPISTEERLIPKESLFNSDTNIVKPRKNVLLTIKERTQTTLRDSTPKDNYKDIALSSESKSSIDHHSEKSPSAIPFRFRPPLESTLKREEENAVHRAEMIKHREVIKQEKISLSKLKMKESLKTEFSPFLFKEDSSKEESRDINVLENRPSFQSLGIDNEAILENINLMGIHEPTMIQERTIPLLMNSTAGSRIYSIMHAMTGSGKTLGFVLPLVNVIDTAIDRVQALIIAPSRELVSQISDVAQRLFNGLDIRVQSIIGGANVKNQLNKLKDIKPHVLIATPGRLAELVFGLKKLSLGSVRALIVDEVDNMLDEPFVGELETLLQSLSIFKNNSRFNVNVNERNNTEMNRYHPSRIKSYVCFASATGNDPKVISFSNKLTKYSWTMVTSTSISEYTLSTASTGSSNNNANSTRDALIPTTITHGLISTPNLRSLEYLRRFLNAKPLFIAALIFVNDPHRVELLCKQLHEMGFIAAPLHGESSKDDRKEILARIKDGRVRIVVSTELAARGLDIPNLTHVINYELPTDSSHYVHRAGRCGRAGKEGLVMNFVNPATKFVIRRFGKQLGVRIRDCELREGQVYLRNV